jgi:hypothetical protein
MYAVDNRRHQHECLSDEPGAAVDPSFHDRRRDVGAFTVADGFSFVIMDVIIDPFCTVEPNPDGRFLVAVDIGDGSRRFVSSSVGAETKHDPCAGGLVVPDLSHIRH